MMRTWRTHRTKCFKKTKKTKRKQRSRMTKKSPKTRMSRKPTTRRGTTMKVSMKTTWKRTKDGTSFWKSTMRNFRLAAMRKKWRTSRKTQIWSMN